MAFFDSPKNRALWNKELESLDAERERRRSEGYKPQREGFRVVMGGAADKNMYANNPKVRRINLKELEEIERKAREAEREAAGMSKTAQKHREGAKRSRANPERQAASTSM